MRNAKVDANQKEIVKALRDLGCSVQSLATVGKGVPDLLVGFKNINYLFEVKDGSKPKSARRLTDDQVVWHSNWVGSVYVIESIDDAILILNQ